MMRELLPDGGVDKRVIQQKGNKGLGKISRHGLTKRCRGSRQASPLSFNFTDICYVPKAVVEL